MPPSSRPSADAFALYAGKLDRSARAWKPTASDAFTAVVVMVPTMSEYFGQWKVSRFVLGDRARGDSFNVVSRLSDIGDILGGLRVIYAGIRPAIATVDPQQAAQTKRELDSLWASSPAPEAGAGRPALHARAGRLARTYGAGAGDRHRRPGDAGGGPAQGQDRAVVRARAVAAVVAAEPRARRVGVCGRCRALAVGGRRSARALRRTGRARPRRRRRRRRARTRPRRSVDARPRWQPAALADRTLRRSPSPTSRSRGRRRARRSRPRAATVWTTILATSFSEAARRRRSRRRPTARGWLLVREFRPPTRFSRAAADATVALDELAAGDDRPARRPLRPYAATCSTRTTRACARRSPGCARPTSSGTTRRAPRWARSRSATGRSSPPCIARSTALRAARR